MKKMVCEDVHECGAVQWSTSPPRPVRVGEGLHALCGHTAHTHTHTHGLGVGDGNVCENENGSVSVSVRKRVGKRM